MVDMVHGPVWLGLSSGRDATAVSKLFVLPPSPTLSSNPWKTLILSLVAALQVWKLHQGEI